MKNFIGLLFLFFCCFYASAQDIIKMKSGSEVKGKIISLDPKYVTFSIENKSDTISIIRDEVSKLQYKNGIIIFLNETTLPETAGDPLTDSLFLKGQKDAISYYKNYKAAEIGTMVASIYFPFGLIPAIACSSTPPNINNLGYRDHKLMENPSYYNGYSKQAHKIKKKKVWQGFAIGSGAIVGVYIIMLAVSLNAL